MIKFRPLQATTPRPKPIAAAKAACAAGLLAALVVGANSAGAALSGDLGMRDVSRIIESDGRFYMYGTRAAAKSSADGLVWKSEPSPQFNASLQPSNQGIWAPDGIFLNGQYYLYGSLWSETSPKKESKITLITSPSLNPASPNYKWTDKGIAINGPSGVTHSVIDPSPSLDGDGNLWVVWGGGYPFDDSANSIFVTRMDNNTGLPLTTDPGWKPPASPGYALKQGHKEGPAIYHRGNYYYLFWQTGSCCSTSNGGYVMHVDRSEKITGPFNGDRVFYNASTKPGVTGPGHMGVYSACGVERFTYHYISSGGSTIIGSNEFIWSADGWPTVGNVVSTPLKPCGNGSAGGGDGGAPQVDAGTALVDSGTTPETDAGSAAGAGGAGGAGGDNGGTGASGGASGSGGSAPETGGSAGEASGSGGSGGSGTAGNASTTAGSGGASTSAGSAGTAGSTAVPPSEEAGCACEVGKARSAQTGRGVLWLVGAALALGARRRRASRGVARL